MEIVVQLRQPRIARGLAELHSLTYSLMLEKPIPPEKAKDNKI
jgi:hypothetical protein